MADPIEPTAIGALTLDCSSLASFLVDLRHGSLRGMLVERPGFAEVIAEILANQSTVGPKAGVTQDDIDGIVLDNQRIADIDAVLPAARKLVEMLEETRAMLDDDRQRRVHAVGGMIEGRARTTESTALLAKYEKTRIYRSATGVKAAKTRKRNSMAESAPPAEETGPV
jgi:hypothetical protein